MTYDQAKAFLLPLIAELTGLRCIWSHQKAPKPSSPFASLRLSPERTLGTDIRGRPDGSGILDVVEQKEATLSVNAYGSGAIDKCNMLWLSLQRPTIVDRCFVAGIAVVRAEAVQDLTALLDGRGWEERASIDLVVTYSRSTTDEPGYITTFRPKTGESTGELGEPDPVTPETDPAIVEVKITLKGVQ